METVIQTNCRLRLVQLGATWEEVAQRSGQKAVSLRGAVSRGTPGSASMERLSLALGVPAHALMDPAFNPKDWPDPADGEAA